MFTIHEVSPDLAASGALVKVQLGVPRSVKSDLELGKLSGMGTGDS